MTISCDTFAGVIKPQSESVANEHATDFDLILGLRTARDGRHNSRPWEGDI